MASFLLCLLGAFLKVRGEAGKLLLFAGHAGPRPKWEQAASAPCHLNVTLEGKMCLLSGGVWQLLTTPRFCFSGKQVSGPEGAGGRHCEGSGHEFGPFFSSSTAPTTAGIGVLEDAPLSITFSIDFRLIWDPFCLKACKELGSRAVLSD